jgi:hypothetical protein
MTTHNEMKEILTPMDIHLVKSLKIIQSALKEWYKNKDHEGKEPYIHIKIYEKIARSDFLKFERELAIQQMEKWWERHQGKMQDISDRIPVKLKNRKTKITKTSADISMKREANSTFIIPSSTNIYEVLEVEELILETPYDDIAMNVEVINNEYIKQSFIEDEYKRNLKLNIVKDHFDVQPIEHKLSVSVGRSYNIHPVKTYSWINEMLNDIDQNDDIVPQISVIDPIGFISIDEIKFPPKMVGDIKYFPNFERLSYIIGDITRVILIFVNLYVLVPYDINLPPQVINKIGEDPIPQVTRSVINSDMYYLYDDGFDSDRDLLYISDKSNDDDIMIN